MNHLGLFAKFWQPGAVKTRLAASIGNLRACELYHEFVFQLIRRLQDSADARSVVFSPPESELEFRKAIPDSWRLCPQSDGDLGKRMSSFFCSQFDSASNPANLNDSSAEKPRPDKIVVIGADCPQLGDVQIQAAFSLLDQAPVVIGPSSDGGYYLIAMRSQYVDIFSNMKWSTDTVFSETVRRLDDLGIQFRTLPTLTDVDDLESLMVLKQELEIRQSEHQGKLPPNDLDRQLLDAIRNAIPARL